MSAGVSIIECTWGSSTLSQHSPLTILKHKQPPPPLSSNLALLPVLRCFNHHYSSYVPFEPGLISALASSLERC